MRLSISYITLCFIDTLLIAPGQAFSVAPNSVSYSRSVQRAKQKARNVFVETSDGVFDEASNVTEDGIEDIGDDHGLSDSKWRKKRYIMMHDITELVRKGARNAPEKAQEMIHRMNHMYENTNQTRYKPTVQAYNLWINALAKSKTTSAGRDAEKVIQEMQDNLIQPNVVSYTSVIDAYARSYSKKNKNAAQDAERILLQLLERQLVDTSISISSVTCDAVLNAWAQQGTFEAAERAQLILERLEHLQSDKIKPTAHSYSAVISGWAKCRDGEAAERAQSILDRLLTQKVVEPDTIVFNSVIHAWATSGDPRAGVQAAKLLGQMKELHSTMGYPTAPDEISYNSVISSWSHSGHVNAAQQAEKVLKQMQSEWNSPNATASTPKPNTISYNTVLDAWSKSAFPGAAKRAQAVLNYMVMASKNDKHSNIAPDVISFTCVLNAWAKSKEPDKALRARELLDEMLDLWHTTQQESLEPSVIPFNTVLNACAFSALGTSDKQRKQALQIAVNTFKQLSNMPEELKVGPDSLSFGNMIKCCCNLMPQGTPVRDQMATRLFVKCCNEGMVGDLVWNEMKRAVPSRVLSRVLESQNIPASLQSVPHGRIRVRDLPRSWWRKTITRRKGPVKRKKTRKEPKEKMMKPVRRMISLTETSWQSGQF